MPTARSVFDASANREHETVDDESPIDFEHLARQTMGDRELEIEILKLFASQARIALNEMAQAEPNKAPVVAHRIKGAARAVGAVKVAAMAERIEAGNADAAIRAGFGVAVIEAEDFINRFCG